MNEEISEEELDELVQFFARNVPTPQGRPKNPVIIAPYGPSCVGKSTVMKYIADRLPLVHIQNDEIRLFLRGKRLDENEFLYEYQLLQHVGEYFLSKGYSVILDANFASNHEHVPKAEKLAERYNAGLFLIRVVAPKDYVINKLKNKRFLPIDEGGLLPNAKTAIEHFLRSSEQFDYEKLTPKTLAIVDSSKPLGPQLNEAVSTLKKAMGEK